MERIINKFVFFVCLFYISLFAKDRIDILPKIAKNGGTFAVVFTSTIPQKKTPKVFFKGKNYPMIPIGTEKTRYKVFIPLDYHLKQQVESVKVLTYKASKWTEKDYYMTIKSGKYKQNEIINVPKSKVILSKSKKQSTSSEYSLVNKKVYSRIVRKDLTNEAPFINPLESKITSDFGNARIYSGLVKNYHTGTDFRAKVGTPIKASNNGVVALVMKRFYLGNVVYINHGYGAYSYYAHLSKPLVEEGEIIRQGQIIAKSGKTGRITGPHLHYAFRLHNTTVDPLQYADLFNKVLLKYH